MVGKKFVGASILIGAFFAPVAEGEARKWKSSDGKTIEAELISATDAEAELKLASGKLYKVPLSRLSEDSQKDVKEWLAAKAAKAAEEMKAKEAEKPKDEGKFIIVKGPDGKEIKIPISGGSSKGGGSGRGKAAKDGPDFVDNFEDEFPKRASAESTTDVEAFKEDEETSEFIYHTAHYEFICDAKLNTSVVRAFARMFEATFDFCRQLPISTQLAHQEAGKNRHKIYLFADIQNYYKNGGPPGSAGVFMGDSKKIMVPLKSLGVEKAGSSSYRIDHDKGSSTLPHEIVHQLTDECYYAHGARGWFTEGLSEYVANTPYTSSGTFKVATNRKSIIANVTAYGLNNEGGRAIGENINMMPLRQWMQIPYYQFTGNAQINYGMGCLVTYYFFHWDGDGDRAAITAFLKALRKGKDGEDALEALLMGRTWDELEKEITNAWRGKGVRINWAEDDGGSMKEKTGFSLE